jgi:hypothetical protein
MVLDMTDLNMPVDLVLLRYKISKTKKLRMEKCQIEAIVIKKRDIM